MTKTSGHARPVSLWRRLRISRVGVAIAVVVFLVLGGTGAYAYWAVQVPMTSSASTGQLAITGQWTVPVSATFTNVTYSKTAQYTVTNNTVATGSNFSTTSMPYTVAFSASGANPGPLATSLDVTVWKSTVASPCNIATPPTAAGHWGGSPLPTASGSLLPGGSEIWCVRTGVAERSQLASATGSVSITPSLVATITLPTTSWSQASAAATGTQATSFIYPAVVPSADWYRLYTGVSGKECSDVRGNGGNNTDVIAYQCNVPESVNQMLRFIPTDTGYVKIVFRHNTALAVGVAGAATTAGSLVQVQSAILTDGSQEWQLQHKGSGNYQIVNRKSGLCLQPDTAATADTPAFKQQVCSGQPIQAFTLELRETIPEFASVVCTNTPSNRTSSSTFKLEWTGALQQPLTVQVRENSTGTWQFNGTAAVGSTEYTVQNRATLITWNKNNTHQYRVVNGAGAALNTGTFRAMHYAGTFGFGAYDYLRCGS